MRFATIKTAEQQAVLTLHRARELLVKQQTMLANLIRGCLGEFGIVAPLGIRRVSELITVINDDGDTRILPEARIAMRAVADQLQYQRTIRECRIVVGQRGSRSVYEAQQIDHTTVFYCRGSRPTT